MKPKDDTKASDKKDPKKDTPAKDSKPADKPKGEAKPKAPPKAAAPPDMPPAEMPMDPAAMPMEMGDDSNVDEIGGAAAPMPPDAGLPPDLGAPATDAAPVHLYGKLSPMSAGYLGPENGPFRCGNCCHFDGTVSCEIVGGDINPDGCCSVFEATDTPAGAQPPQLDAQITPDMGAPIDDGQAAGAPPPTDFQG